MRRVPVFTRDFSSLDACAERASFRRVRDSNQRAAKGGAVAEIKGKGFESADEVREFKDGKGKVELVDLNGHMIGRGTFEPGWRWSEHVKPLSGTDSCQVEHIGYVLEGEMTVRMDDGSELHVGPGDAFHMPPGHDAWVEEERCVLLDFGGLQGYAKGN
jgi:quercetin dioxygenase-like cupin family protein